MSVFFVVLQENLHRVSLNLIRNDNALTDDKSYDMLKQRRCMIETMKRFEAVIFDMDGVRLGAAGYKVLAGRCR